jgi:hypothetical protein
MESSWRIKNRTACFVINEKVDEIIIYTMLYIQTFKILHTLFSVPYLFPNGTHRLKVLDFFVQVKIKFLH